MHAMTIHKTTLAALAHLVHAIRHDTITARNLRAREWDPPGILRALEAVANRPLADVAVAAIRAASDRLDQDTPAIIAASGSHWAGTVTAQQPVRDVCPYHPDRLLPCVDCADYASRVAPPDRIRAIREGR